MLTGPSSRAAPVWHPQVWPVPCPVQLKKTRALAAVPTCDLSCHGSSSWPMGASASLEDPFVCASRPPTSPRLLCPSCNSHNHTPAPCFPTRPSGGWFIFYFIGHPPSPPFATALGATLGHQCSGSQHLPGSQPSVLVSAWLCSVADRPWHSSRPLVWA